MSEFNEDEDLRFYQEVAQWQELRDIEYEIWAEQLDSESLSMWYDFVEEGEPE